MAGAQEAPHHVWELTLVNAPRMSFWGVGLADWQHRGPAWGHKPLIALFSGYAGVHAAEALGVSQLRITQANKG